MAIDKLFVTAFSGDGFTGNVADIDEGIEAADGLFVSSDSNAKNDVLRTDFDDTIVLGSDSVSQITFKFRIRIDLPGSIDSFRVQPFIGDTELSTGASTTSVDTFFKTFTLRGSGGGFGGGLTPTEINDLNLRIWAQQTGMPIDVQWDCDCNDLWVYYNLDRVLRPKIQSMKYRHILMR